MRRKTRSPVDEERLGSWKPWTPREAGERLQDLGIPWCVVGGWALDLWRGEQTRFHEDIEIAVPRSTFPVIRNRLSKYKLFSVGDGQVHALPPGSAPPLDKHQNWVLDKKARAWRLDIFLEPGDPEIWVFRRNENIRFARSRMIAASAEGIPYLKPEAVLLFKAKLMREKDETDFAASLPLMQPDARAWLKDALAIAHPGHVWIGKLT